MILAEGCSIACFCETWLQPDSINDSALVINNYSMFRRDRRNRFRGGGLLVYVKSDLCPHLRPDLSPRHRMYCLGIQTALSR